MQIVSGYSRGGGSPRRSRLRAAALGLALGSLAPTRLAPAPVINIAPSVLINDPLRYLRAVALMTHRRTLGKKTARRSRARTDSRFSRESHLSAD